MEVQYNAKRSTLGALLISSWLVDSSLYQVVPDESLTPTALVNLLLTQRCFRFLKKLAKLDKAGQAHRYIELDSMYIKTSTRSESGEWDLPLVREG